MLKGALGDVLFSVYLEELLWRLSPDFFFFFTILLPTLFPINRHLGCLMGSCLLRRSELAVSSCRWEKRHPQGGRGRKGGGQVRDPDHKPALPDDTLTACLVFTFNAEAGKISRGSRRKKRVQMDRRGGKPAPRSVTAD